MKIAEILTEGVSVKDQILADVKRHGGSPNEYFVRFTDIDKLGFSARQWFGKTPDTDHPDFSVDYIGHSKGRPVLWFYPLSVYLDDTRTVYASEQPYTWLVKLKPNAWLQTVDRGDKGIQSPPSGKQRVGLLRMSRPPAAMFFTHGYDVIGKYYNFKRKHKPHGQIKGPPPPTWFDRIRGYN